MSENTRFLLKVPRGMDIQDIKTYLKSKKAKSLSLTGSRYEIAELQNSQFALVENGTQMRFQGVYQLNEAIKEEKFQLKGLGIYQYAEWAQKCYEEQWNIDDSK